MAAIKYYVNRIETYNLDQAKRQKEMDIVKQIIKSNKYDTQTLNKICNKREKQEQDNRKKKWARFTHMVKETRYITKLFKNTDVKISYTTNNNLGKLLATRTDQNLDKYERNGVYQLECPSCNKKYIGQMALPFKVRFHEHYNNYKYRHNKPEVCTAGHR
jgi:uncharacterized protein (UPF0335 family)